MTRDPYGRQLTGADPISKCDIMEAEKVADLSDGEQAGTREIVSAPNIAKS